MTAIAIIPARGGSKRIPRKNIKDFCGKPIIGYSIEVAQRSNLFERIIVSTDDEEIAKVSMSYGADIPFMRPKELADDFTGTNEVAKHALQWAKKKDSSVKYACCIYATAPFIQPAYLKQGYEKLVSTGKNYVFSVTTFAFPIQRAIRISGNGDADPLFPEYISHRSQDLEEAYHDAGQFYWGKYEAFISGAPIYGPNSLPIIMPRHLVQDIDTEEDWYQAEMMFRAIQ